MIPSIRLKLKRSIGDISRRNQRATAYPGSTKSRTAAARKRGYSSHDDAVQIENVTPSPSIRMDENIRGNSFLTGAFNVTFLRRASASGNLTQNCRTASVAARYSHDASLPHAEIVS